MKYRLAKKVYEHRERYSHGKFEKACLRIMRIRELREMEQWCRGNPELMAQISLALGNPGLAFQTLMESDLFF